MGMYGKSVEDAIINTGKGRTKQSETKKCDINSIMAKVKKGQMVVYLNGQKPVFGDFSDGLEYQDALNKIIEAEKEFKKLSADVRKKFDNDPGKLIDFLNNEANKEEAIKLGLLPVVKEEGGGTTTPSEPKKEV